MATSNFANKPWYKPIAMVALAPAHPLNTVPRTYHQAMNSPEAESWLDAVNDELAAMRRLHIYDVVPILPDFALIGTVWVFRRKFDVDGNPIKLKAQLCAQGNAQQEGINFNKT
jgi:hypothetical protein